MGADLSRIRSNPLLDFGGVELKQGGVLLDADFNELVAATDRRVRAAASDILGRSTVSSTTPDAFKISLASGSLLIGTGRLYVDGLLAECHGAISTDPAKKLFDPLMAEVYFADLVPYLSQPYLPAPPSLPTTGRHLVYLDVWKREVTYLERPELVEVAVGVETSSRMQTVWQVRVLKDEAGNVTCSDDLAGWSDLIAPSTGRLTTGTFDMPPETDPCELPPTGGYRGLENQAYRVEIHDPGQPGAAATFKWSRDNASVGSRVASMVSATELELQTLGRDDVLRFNTGDWVEILDDVREFSQRSGEMRQITVNEAARRITFAPALPAEMTPTAYPSSEFPRDRNLRVRRWDQKHKVLKTGSGGSTSLFEDLDAGTTGLIPVPAAGTTLLLESGVTVSFSSTGAKGFRAGDFWVFAARTADASVEPVVNEPPRGIHHHYERLALWDVAAGAVTDCRHPWAPWSCCTEVVFPGEDIQAAIDRLPAAGGCVCLKVGLHEIREALRIERSNVTLHGETVGAVVRNRVSDEALRIADPTKATLTSVYVEEVRFEVGPSRQTGSGTIQLSNVDGGAVRQCRIALSSERQAAVSVAIAIHDSHAVEVAGNEIEQAMAGVLAFDSEGLTIRENTIHSAPVEELSVGLLGVALMAGATGLELPAPATRVSQVLNFIERNEVEDFCTGIFVGPGYGPTRIASNMVTRKQVRGGDTFRPALDTTVTIGALDKFPRWWAIDVRVPGCTITDNRTPLAAGILGGILFTAGETVIARNDIRSAVREGEDLLPMGIVGLGLVRRDVVEHCAIRGNRLDGVQSAITVAAETGADVNGIEIVENRIGAQFEAFGGLSKKVETDFRQVGAVFGSLGRKVVTQFAIWVEGVQRAVVLRNQIEHTVSAILGGRLTDALIESNRVATCALGIFLDRGEGAHVYDNVLDDLVVWGILDIWGNATSISGTRVTRCSGYAVFVLGGVEHRITGGQVSGVGLGILVSAAGSRVDDVTVTDARHGGVVALVVPGEIGMTNDRLLRCGESRGDPQFPVTVALAVFGGLGHVDVDACEIRDTGEPGYPGPRFDLFAYLTQSARIHGCNIVGRPSERPDPRTHAIAALTLPWTGEPSFADLLDNEVAVSGNTIVDCLAFRGETMCATNHVINRYGNVDFPSFRAFGQVVTATGNRVSALGAAPSLMIFATNTLSAVGNVSTHGAIINGASFAPPGGLSPTPYVTFNASA